MTEVIRDEEVRRRIRLAQELLDPGTRSEYRGSVSILTNTQTMFPNEGIVPHEGP